MSCLLTQQMSCLLTQQMSCLQTQQMSCLQTHWLRLGATRPEMLLGHNLQLGTWDSGLGTWDLRLGTGTWVLDLLANSGHWAMEGHGGTRAKMVLGHNLQHMAPFGMLTTAFRMFFQDATLVFSTPGSIFGLQI